MLRLDGCGSESMDPSIYVTICDGTSTRASAAIRAKTKLKHDWLIYRVGWL
jgi:hypothetical protein